MANPLADILSGLGNVLDTPGSVVRGLLAGDASSALGGVLDPSRRISGRGLLDRLGVTNENSGILGDVGGFAAQVATDPLTWLGGSLARRILGHGAEAASASSKASSLSERALGTSNEAESAVGELLRRSGAAQEAAPLARAAESAPNLTYQPGRLKNIPTQNVGVFGENLYGGPGPLSEAEQWTGRRFSVGELENRKSDLHDALVRISSNEPTGVKDLLPLRRQFTKANLMVGEEDIPSARTVGGQFALEPGQTPASRMDQVRDSVSKAIEEMVNVPGTNAIYDIPGRTAVIPEFTPRPIARHEIFHGLSDIARRTGDSSALGPVGRISNLLQSSDSPLLNTLGIIGEEAGAHGAEQVGRLAQLQRMMEFLNKPISQYEQAFAQGSPLAASIYGTSAIPRVGLGLAGAGGAGLLAALGAGSQ